MMSNLSLSEKQQEYSNEDIKKAKYGDLGQANRLIGAKHKK
jgi:hypothetical protein